MNGISILEPATATIPRNSGFLVLLLACLAACSAPASEGENGSGDRAAGRYGVAYELTIDADAQAIDVEVTITQSRRLLREMSFDVPPARLSGLAGDGDINVVNDRVTWLPPQTGGSLRWRAQVPARHGDGGYDAWLDSEWGIFRAEDIIPRAASRTLKGAESTTTLRINLPDGWSAVTEYAARDGQYEVVRPARRLSQPAGWIAVGDLGVRRETIEGIRVAVAAPVGQSVRRMDILAMANWVLPELARLLPAVPPRITIVSAGDPMWRGGLSAPQSIYLHADRPLISENGTSTLVHELLHVSLGLDAEPSFDWIVEGLAEYYTLRLLRQSGTITARRYERALATLADWSNEADVLCAPSSSGATTALAVTTLHTLDEEIRAKTEAKQSLDDVLFELVASGRPLSLAHLAESSAGQIGEFPDALHSRGLPGCPTLAAAIPLEP